MIQSIVRKHILQLKPYSSARDEFQGEASVYLDANENPYPSAYNRYPDPHQHILKEKIAAIKNSPSSSIFLGNGSDEAIDLLIRLCCEPTLDHIIIAQPTYGMYAVSAAINQVSVRDVLLTNDFDLDIDRILDVCNEHSKIIFLCSPNNPTGNLLNKSKICSLANSFQGIVVVDEAYIDFAEDEGFLPIIHSYPNIVVLQTFSKAWGLAGLRLGMCWADESIITLLNKIKPPYNISTLTQQIALEKLHLMEQKNAWVKQIQENRKNLMDALQPISIVEKIYPSDANFILVRTTQGKKIYSYLVDQKIIVRDRSSVVLCGECLRITVGTADENNLLIDVLKKYKP